MRQWSDGWALHAETFKLAWRFTSKNSTVRREEQRCPLLYGWEDKYREALASYIKDRRKGSVPISFDVKAYVQVKFKDIEERISGMTTAKPAGREEAVLDRLRQELAQNRRKIQELGIKGYDKPKPAECESLPTKMRARRKKRCPTGA